MLTADIVRHSLDYDPATGVFTWKPKPGCARYDRAWNKRHAGKRAGRSKPNNHGYFEIAIDSVLYKSSRLAWLYMTGDCPINQIDHINLNKLDDRFENLREATVAQNGWNTNIRQKNATGFKGVYLYKPTNRYYCQFSVNRQRLYVGYFDTPEEAHAAYAKEIAKHHGEFARAA